MVSEEPTLVKEPTYIPHEFFGRLSAPYGSREDRYLLLALKLGIVIALLAFEAVLIYVVAYGMWRIVHVSP